MSKYQVEFRVWPHDGNICEEVDMKEDGTNFYNAAKAAEAKLRETGKYRMVSFTGRWKELK